MKKYLLILTAPFLMSCSTLFPSPWDSNESEKITDIRMTIQEITCDQNVIYHYDIQHAQNLTNWLIIYAQDKNDADVIKLLTPFKKTLDEFNDHLEQKNDDVAYCKIKVQILDSQAKIIAKAIQGRNK